LLLACHECDLNAPCASVSGTGVPCLPPASRHHRALPPGGLVRADWPSLVLSTHVLDSVPGDRAMDCLLPTTETTLTFPRHPLRELAFTIQVHPAGYKRGLDRRGRGGGRRRPRLAIPRGASRVVRPLPATQTRR
jgi:hypothetical protein